MGNWIKLKSVHGTGHIHIRGCHIMAMMLRKESGAYPAGTEIYTTRADTNLFVTETPEEIMAMIEASERHDNERPAPYPDNETTRTLVCLWNEFKQGGGNDE
jgi:hypothetical protein